MLKIYQSLNPKEKALVWAAVIGAVVLVASAGGNGAGIVAGAQVAAALGTLILAALAFAQVRELRETRIAQERPQVIVDEDYSDPPMVYVVVRNIGKGAAKDITFDFSAPIASPASADPHTDMVPVSELPYFAQGADYLAPGTEIRFFWGSMITLGSFLQERGLQDGITITSQYKSLAGEPYETKWTVNPLLVWGRGYLQETTIKDLTKVMNTISKDLSRIIDPVNRELKVSTESERKQRRDQGNDKGI